MSPSDLGERRNPLDPRSDLSRLIEHQRALGDADALRIGDQHYSYAELAALVAQRATALIGAGVSAGELVLCPTTPVLDSLLMQWALARVGAALLPIRADLPSARRESLIRATGAEWRWEPADPNVPVAAQTSGSRRSGAEARTQRPLRLIKDVHGQPAGTLSRFRSGHRSASVAIPAAAFPVTARPATPAWLTSDVSSHAAVLVETSGSSADPKIVMLSAANITASCRLVNARLDLQRGDRWLSVLPRQHVGGLAIGYRCALAGAELVVQTRFDADSVRAALCDQGITHVSLVPAMLERLLGIEPKPPPCLRVVLVGGQDLDAGLGRRAVEAGWPLYLGYGMSETFSQIAGSWIGADGLPRSGLMPLDGVEIDSPSCDQAPPQGQPLRIRAPMLMLGYANPTRTPGDGLDQGWLQTSDLACRHADGGLQVLGRADDVVLIAGINVLPAEIERTLARLDQITDIAVVGVPDPTWGHRLAALYSGDLEPTQLAAWCRGHLPSHQRPRAFVRLERLPTLSAGKRDRRALIALAAAADQAGLSPGLGSEASLAPPG